MIESHLAVRRAVVVVPAHDEELLLNACLASVVDAGNRVDVECELVVVLDACSDTSADIAAYWSAEAGATVVAIDRRNVGAARAAGFLAASTGRDTWFATTDGDSVVPSNWLVSQLVHARRGAQVVAGTVVTDLGSAHPSLTVAYEAGYRHRPGHRHVHGANLGMRADAYWTVGGFGALRSDEDVDLISRFEHSAVPISYVADAPVRTSARRIGRAPDGFAAHLRDLELAVAL
ncbi:MAG: glycosyltransferase family A protein [Rhodococcus sp. (in: high G+C Gram-positive bacteria)]